MRHFQSPGGRIVIFIESAQDFAEMDRLIQRGLNTWEPRPESLESLSKAVRNSLDRASLKSQNTAAENG